MKRLYQLCVILFLIGLIGCSNTVQTSKEEVEVIAETEAKVEIVAATKPEIDVDWQLYKVKKDDKYLYLLGTLHYGRKEMYPFPDKIKDALKESKYLVTELDVDGMYYRNEGKELDYMFLLEEEESLEEYLTDKSEKHLKEMSNKFQIDYNTLLTLKPFLVRTTFEATAGIKEYSFSYGVDLQITALANLYKMEKKFLETIRYQFEMLELAYPLDKTDEIILAIPEKSVLQEQNMQTIESYFKGDTKVLMELFMKDKRMKEVLIDKRNREWVPKLKSYLESGDIHFVAVGLGHFDGENGLLSLLEKEGYSIEKK
ncbi:TraB/GumN family protein [Brevibacillus daliensis]|uniref:TraB/GumN family protein n=1 Tax=Brevibacillus daliensis TaxID=2892995 RepID=UPI001E5093E2|nr:TraB/GumN family protein [Brevibacillus daliensis]